MILSRYATAIAKIDHDPALAFLVRRSLRLSRRPILYALSERGLGQSDLVLALLRIGTRGARVSVERIVGRPILIGAPVRLAWRVNGRPTITRARRITRVAPNPRKPNTEAHARYEMTFSPGRTIDEAMARGARKRDVRRALREGWIEVSA